MPLEWIRLTKLTKVKYCRALRQSKANREGKKIQIRRDDGDDFMVESLNLISNMSINYT